MNNDNFFSRRLAAYREERKITQEELSEAMGFKDRQTLSAIEKGERKLRPDELIKALVCLNVTFEEFADPYSLIGEACFSWRQSDASPLELTDFELSTSKIIALYRELREKYADSKTSVILPKLPINKNSSLKDAQYCAELLVEEFGLGDFPAENLEEKLYENFNILTLFIETSKNVSGAAVRLSNLSVILVNRNEVVGRRNFDKAHEVFHCLTWDALPPKHIEYGYKTSNKPYEEKLADAFASALLMPKKSIEKYFCSTKQGLDEEALNTLANKFRVSSQALKWRLVSLNKINMSTAKKFDEASLVNNGNKVSAKKPRLLNKQYVDYLQKALDNGSISVRKAASTLGLKIEELESLLEDYDLQIPFEL